MQLCHFCIQEIGKLYQYHAALQWYNFYFNVALKVYFKSKLFELHNSITLFNSVYTIFLHNTVLLYSMQYQY